MFVVILYLYIFPVVFTKTEDDLTETCQSKASQPQDELRTESVDVEVFCPLSDSPPEESLEKAILRISNEASENIKKLNSNSKKSQCEQRAESFLWKKIASAGWRTLTDPNSWKNAFTLLQYTFEALRHSISNEKSENHNDPVKQVARK